MSHCRVCGNPYNTRVPVFCVFKSLITLDYTFLYMDFKCFFDCFLCLCFPFPVEAVIPVSCLSGSMPHKPHDLFDIDFSAVNQGACIGFPEFMRGTFLYSCHAAAFSQTVVYAAPVGIAVFIDKNKSVYRQTMLLIKFINCADNLLCFFVR